MNPNTFTIAKPVTRCGAQTPISDRNALATSNSERYTGNDHAGHLVLCVNVNIREEQ